MKKIITLLLSLYFTVYIFAQENSNHILIQDLSVLIENRSDSTVCYAKRAMDYFSKERDTLNFYKVAEMLSKYYHNNSKFNKEIKHLESLNYSLISQKDKINVYLLLGKAYLSQSKIQEAKANFNKALELSKYHNDPANIAKAYNAIGVSHMQYEDLETATNYFIKAVKIATKTENDQLLTDIKINLGIIYQRTNQYPKAIKTYLALLESIPENRVVLLINIFNNLGNFYRHEKETEQAVKYYKQALQLAIEHNMIQKEASVLHNLGAIFDEQHDFKNAKLYLTKAYEIGKKNNLPRELAHSLNSLVALSLKTKDYDNTLQYINKGLILCENYNLPVIESELIRLQAEYLFQTEYYQAAYVSLQLYNHIHDSIQQLNNVGRIEQIQAIYNVKNQEQENRVLKVQNKLSNDLLDEKQTVLVYTRLFIFITLIFFIAVLLLFNNKLKLNKKLILTNKKLESANNTKDKFFSIIAHDLRSPFGTIIGFSEILSFSLKESKEIDKDKIMEYANHINESTKTVYDLLENLLLWAKNEQNRLTFSPQYFDLYELINTNKELYHLRAREKNITFTSKVKEQTIVNADINMVNTILRNLISNAIKFTNQGGSVILDANKKGETIYISVKDNGVGIKEEMYNKLFNLSTNQSTKGTNDEAGSGLGLILCKQFTEKNGGKIWVESKPNIGSTFYFTLPIG